VEVVPPLAEAGASVALVDTPSNDAAPAAERNMKAYRMPMKTGTEWYASVLTVRHFWHELRATSSRVRALMLAAWSSLLLCRRC